MFLIPLDDSKTRFFRKSGKKKQILKFSKNFEQFRFFDKYFDFFKFFEDFSKTIQHIFLFFFIPLEDSEKSLL